MSGDQKKSFKPTQFITDPLSRILTLFVAWLVFNLVLIAGIWLLVRLTHIDVDPAKVQIAKWLTKDRMIDLQEIAPGIQTIRHVFRMDTDGDKFREWVVFYSYDEVSKGRGPYGAAVYDVDRCRPPAIVSYELRPYDYNYVTENLDLKWAAGPQMTDINGDSRQELVIHIGNDLSVFRWYDHTQNCTVQGPGQQGYDLLGTFRGTGGVNPTGGGRVQVLDRGFFDRSQIAIRRVYAPGDTTGSYLQPGDGLYPPKETSLAFTFGQPITITDLYYPEKAVLAFYLNLGQNDKAAQGYLSDMAKKKYNIKTDPFGLYSAADGVARARDKLTRVLVWEIRYIPNIDRERLHETQQVTVLVVGVNGDQFNPSQSCQVTWEVIGVPNSSALPYGCEWRLDSYQSTCPSPGEKGEMEDGGQLIGRIAP